MCDGHIDRHTMAEILIPLGSAILAVLCACDLPAETGIAVGPTSQMEASGEADVSTVRQ